MDSPSASNWFPFRKRETRVKVGWLLLDDCPVEYTAVPHAVRGKGDGFHVNGAMSF